MTVRCKALANDRGAAFLLAIYFSALILLLVGGVSLQRTNIEVRAAQLSRDMQQAFWLSEGAIDRSLKSITTETLNMSDEYTVNQLMGATFKLTPVRAEIYNNNISPTAHKKVFKNLMNPYQKILKRIEATGKIGTMAKQDVYTYIEENAPLSGVWANETIAIGGGNVADPKDIFVDGSLFSARGSVVSTFGPPAAGESYLDTDGMPTTVTSGKNVMKFDGVVQLADASPAVTVSSPLEDKVGNWGNSASGELKGIKRGYEIMNNIHGTLYGDKSAHPEKAGVTFANPKQAVAEESDYVEGLLSVGMFPTSTVTTTKNCSAVVKITKPEVVIDDNFRCDPTHEVEGMTCTGGSLMDSQRDAGKIELCAKAILPDPDNKQSWDPVGGGDIINHPPKLIFKEPTTLALVGAETYSLVGTPFSINGNPPIALTSHLFDILNRSLNTKLLDAWHVQLAATLVSESPGDTIEVFQSTAKRKKDRTTDYPVIFVRPGDIFEGSIYAPASLVVMRGRECAATAEGCKTALNIQYVVGNEVAIELETDKLSIGSSGSLAPTPGEISNTVKSWTMHKSE